jgi:hypothetical protein
MRRPVAVGLLISPWAFYLLSAGASWTETPRVPPPAESESAPIPLL